MSAGSRARSNRRWLDWKPTDQTNADSTQGEPTKPSKPGFVGFVGPISVGPAKIEPELNPSRGPSGVPQGISHAGESVSGSPNERKESIQPGVDCAGKQERVMSWSDWKAAALNRLFLEQGLTGQSGRITGDTVRHGQRKQVNDE